MTDPSRKNAGPEACDLVPRLLSLSKTIRQLVAIKLADCGVAVGQDQFLMLFANEEALSVVDIAARLSVRASTVSKMTDILQRKGWVVRSADDQDARRVLVHLTGEGRNVREAVSAIEAALNVELATALGEHQDTIGTLVRLDRVLARRLSRLR